MATELAKRILQKSPRKKNFTTKGGRTTLGTGLARAGTNKAQTTASLEAVVLAIEEVVPRQMIESASTVVLAETTIIPLIQLPPLPLPPGPPLASLTGLPAPPASVAQQRHQCRARKIIFRRVLGSGSHTHD